VRSIVLGRGEGQIVVTMIELEKLGWIEIGDWLTEPEQRYTVTETGKSYGLKNLPNGMIDLPEEITEALQMVLKMDPAARALVSWPDESQRPSV
jgi:DNA-binding PadR family transcriptional regulator